MTGHSTAFQPRTVLVTGGAGFIGGWLVRYLLRTNPDLRVVTLDNLTYAGSIENLGEAQDNPRHLFVRGDICDRALVERVLQDSSIDAVMHLAAESHVDRSITGPAAFIETNVVGTQTLLDAARAYRETLATPFRFLHVSTDEVYGSLGRTDPPFTETSPYAPNSPYAASKASSDLLVRAYHRTYGFPALITNCSNNFGPNQHAEKFIPTVIRACLTQKPIPIYGDGSNVRDWLYVEDHCAALWLALQRGRLGETYNVGGDCERANIDLARAICALIDARRRAAAPHAQLMAFVEDRKGHDWRYAIESGKISAELGWRPEVTFNAGLARTVDWYLARAEGA